MNQIKTGILLSYIILILNTLIQIVYTPIMLRLLGQHEYGLYTLSNGIISYLSLFDLGLSGAYLKFYAKYKSNCEDNKIIILNSTFLSVFIILSFFTVLSGFTIAFHIEEFLNKSLSGLELIKAKKIMILLTLSLGITLISNVFSSIILAHEKFIKHRSVQLLKIIFNPLISIPLMIIGYGSLALSWGTLISAFFTLIVYMHYCIKKLKCTFCLKKISKELLKEVGKFSFFIFLNDIISQINWNVDKILLGYFHGTIATAIYGVGSQIDVVYRSLSSAISSVYLPKINFLIAQMDNDHEVDKLFVKIGRIQYFLIMLVLLEYLTFGKFFIQLWAGTQYSESFYVALCLIVPVTIPLIQNLGIEIQRAKNKHQFRGIIYSLMAVINIIISIPLCKKYGSVGCALGTSFSLLFGNGIIINWYYHRHIGLNIKYFWLEILKESRGLILPIICVITLYYLKFEWTFLTFIVGGSIFAIIYFVSMWLWGLNNNEKSYICNLIKKVVKYD